MRDREVKKLRNKSLDWFGQPYDRDYGQGASTNSPKQVHGNLIEMFRNYAKIANDAEAKGYSVAKKQEANLS